LAFSGPNNSPRVEPSISSFEYDDLGVKDMGDFLL